MKEIIGHREMQNFPKGTGYGCYAYCLDFCAFVFHEYYNFDFQEQGYNKYYDEEAGVRNDVKFSSFNQVNNMQSSDIIWTGSHYFVVIQRTGNVLYTCEGSAGKKEPTGVVVTDSHYEIRNSTLYDLWNKKVLDLYRG